MSNDNADTNSILNAYLTGMLHADLLMIRNDLRMADIKAALAKVDDAIKLIDEKLSPLLNEHKFVETNDFGEIPCKL